MRNLKKALLAGLVLAAGWAPKASAEAGFQETFTVENLRRYYAWRKKLALDEAQRRAIQAEWDRYMAPVSAALGPVPSSSGGGSGGGIPLGAPSSPTGPAGPSGSGSFSGLFGPAGRRGQPPSVGASSPVDEVARTPEERARLQGVWQRIQAHARRHSPEDDPALREFFAMYLWQVYTSGGSSGNADIAEHVAFIHAQVDAESGKEVLPDIRRGRMPGVANGEVLAYMVENSREIVFSDRRAPNPVTGDHEMFHFTDNMLHGAVGARTLEMNDVRRVLARLDGQERPEDARDAPNEGQPDRLSAVGQDTSSSPSRGSGSGRRCVPQGAASEPRVIAAEEHAYRHMGGGIGMPAGVSILSGISGGC